MSLPFFAVYGATKAALKIFIESVNAESEKTGASYKILNVSSGSIKGSGFYAGQTDIDILSNLTRDIIEHLEAKDDLFIPKYEEMFKDVLEGCHRDFYKEGAHSYEYKSLLTR